MEIDNEKITRLEVISEKGREFVKYCKIHLVIQDNGRTLKIIING